MGITAEKSYRIRKKKKKGGHWLGQLVTDESRLNRRVKQKPVLINRSSRYKMRKKLL